eukprot:2400899-Pyramimonas_sp.AAC.1
MVVRRILGKDPQSAQGQGMARDPGEPLKVEEEPAVLIQWAKNLGPETLQHNSVPRCKESRRGGLVDLADPKLPIGQVKTSDLLSRTPATRSILVGGALGKLCD